MGDVVQPLTRQPDRPFGHLAVGIALTDAEHDWLIEVLDILSREPSFDELPATFARAVHATPDMPLGVLHSFGSGEERPRVSFTPRRSGDGWILDIVSLGVDIGALAALVAIVAPSQLASSLGFPYTPVHDRSKPLDPQTLSGESRGGLVRITHANISITDATLPFTVGLGQWTYPTPP